MVADGQSKGMAKVIHCEGDGGLPIVDCGKDGVGHWVVVAGIVKFTYMFEIKMRRGVAESVSKGAKDKVCHKILIGAVLETRRDGSGKTDVIGSNNNGSE